MWGGAIAGAIDARVDAMQNGCDRCDEGIQGTTVTLAAISQQDLHVGVVVATGAVVASAAMLHNEPNGRCFDIYCHIPYTEKVPRDAMGNGTSAMIRV